jgi:DNA polymerase-3 subunit gamma/tau
MLTREAFNALLKTLEEPPAHAIFVLVTTEVHKVPPTVLSRCQRFDFERINIEDLINRLYFIAQKENLNIHKEALRLIACNAQGGLRDAISLLDQLVSYGGKSVTLGQVRSVLGLADIKSLEKLTDLLVKKDTEKAIKLVNEIFSKGYDLHQFTKGIIEYLRSILIIKLSGDKKLLQFSPEQINKIIAQSKEINLSKVLNLIKLFVKAEKDLKMATFPQLPLELALVESSQEEEIEKEIVSKEIKKESKEINEPSAALATNNKSYSAKASQDRLKSTENDLCLKEILDFWEQILEEVKLYNHSVCAFLKASRPIVVKKDKITLEFFYPFHKERIEDQKNLHLVEEAIHKVTERSYKVLCVLGERRDIAKTNNKEDKESNNLLQSAQEIFKNQAE